MILWNKEKSDIQAGAEETFIGTTFVWKRNHSWLRQISTWDVIISVAPIGDKSNIGPRQGDYCLHSWTLSVLTVEKACHNLPSGVNCQLRWFKRGKLPHVLDLNPLQVSNFQLLPGKEEVDAKLNWKPKKQTSFRSHTLLSGYFRQGSENSKL